jgi:hypothetical protein
MVMMALVDNKIDPDEAEPIEKMAKALNYTQVDVNMLVRRAQGKLQKLIAKSSKTPKPKAKQKSSSQKQPPPLPAETKKKPPPPPPVKTAPPPKPAPPKPVQPKPVQTKPVPPKPESPADPAPVKEPTVAKKPSSTVDTCKQARDATANPSEYCFGYGSGEINTWGCRLMGMNWAPGAEWLHKGYFRDNSTFVFDKKELVNQVTKSFLKCKDCPYINIDYVETAFDLLPSRASIVGRWTHHKAERHSPLAQELEIRKNIHGCETREQILAEGVDPVGIRGALKIIKQATRKAQSNPPDYKLLEQ